MHVKFEAQAMIRCRGITKAGKQCSITSSSNWVDNNGRVVAQPLCRGGGILHNSRQAFLYTDQTLDLETTGTDILQDIINI